MKQRIFSIILTLCLCLSSQPVAQAYQESPSLQENVHTKKSTSELDTPDSTIPTPTEVYNTIITLKEQEKFKEGTAWTNDTPYSNPAYKWQGGPLDGTNIVAVGCVAFAFELSDKAFGSLPARMYAEGKFSYDDIKAGDILRVSNDAHTVIVLEVSDTGVVIAEGNNNGKVHWERAISKEELISNPNSNSYISHYITRYPENYVSPDDPEADTSIGSGTLDGGLSWNLTQAGTLTISGEGAMPDFAGVGEQPWKDNSSKIRKVIIGNGVTNIGACAFWNCGVLSAEIPSSVTSIGNYAFDGSSIISVTIPSSVKTIGDSAFHKCQNLSTVTLSEGLETISQNAFSSCTSLTSIAFPVSITEVGAGAFWQCYKMTSATFAPGSKQVQLGDNIFTQCYELMNVTLPTNINCIGTGMFQNCLLLTKVEIPQGAKSIGESAFASCSRLTAVTIPDSVTEIGIAAFSASSLTDIYFTGTKEQWNSISKLGDDTATTLSKVTIHYSDTSTTNPDTDDNNGNNSGNNTGNNSGNGSNSNTGNNSGSNSGNGSNSNTGNNTGSNTGNNTGNNSGSNSGNGDNSSNNGNNTDNNSGNGDNSGNNGNNTDNNSGNGDNSGNNDSNTDNNTNNTPGNDDNSNNTGSTPVNDDNSNNTDNTPGNNDNSNNTDSTPGNSDNSDNTDNDTENDDSSNNTGNIPDSDESQAPDQEQAPLTKGDTFTNSKVAYKVTKAGNEVKLVTSKSKAASITINTVKGTDGAKYKVTSIGPKVMQNNKKVTNLTIGANVKTIGANAFSGCTNLKTVTFGKNITKIEANAFKGCKKLSHVTIKSTKLNSIGKQAFKGTKSNLKVKVPSKQLEKYRKLLKKAGLKAKQITKI